MKLSRRAFTGAAVAASLAYGAQSEYKLIAHRGGIVDEEHAENSPASIRAAIDRGYWMLEVDIRRTADGHQILQHDLDFRRYYGVDTPVAQLTWAEVRQLKANPGGSSPMHFRDVCRMCEGKVRLMLDIKGDDWPDEFYLGLVNLLGEHQLLRTAYVLGGNRVKGFFRGKAWLSANRTSLRQAINRGEDVGANYFLFELGSVLDQFTLNLCRSNRVVAVAALNTFRYTQAGRDEQKGAEEDAAKLLRMGVTHYQIDSRYEHLFRRAH